MKYIDFDNSFCKECDAGLEGDALLRVYIDGCPKNPYAEGHVVATVTLTKHGDIAVEWHEVRLRFNEKVLSSIADAKRKLLDNWDTIQNYPEEIWVDGSDYGDIQKLKEQVQQLFGAKIRKYRSIEILGQLENDAILVQDFVDKDTKSVIAMPNGTDERVRILLQ